ncbi:S1C family serine protease [Sporofaciens sp. SGI.106]|uniref:S1C family serine protease n=1 Tax=Sporofaciens sp. SGI.106 TaxID=3420568 RepID=UPI002A9703E8|nr:trypsin-like peptidase domain-containing protein [Lachnoclostridium sp.]
MDNQYNYYNPNSEDNNNIFDEAPRQGQSPRPKTEKKKFPKVIGVIGLAIVFGLVASLTFQAGNLLAGKLLGTNDSAKTAKQTATVNNTQLSKTSSTVTSDVSGIVDSAMPSVVSITNMSVQQVQSFFGGVQQQESQSCGSGIIIGQNDTELLIVTNNHVVEGSQTLTVSFIDEESVEANIKGTDSTKDLAVVAVPLESIKDETMDKIAVAQMGDSDSLKVGEPVIAIGNALGYGQSVTTGIVSAKDRDIQMEGFDSKLIQTDAAINPGNSGGALLNVNGEVIGINTVKVNANAVEGMGYAIPISDASEVITTLMNRETRTKVSDAEKGYLGIQGVDVSSDSAQMYNMPTGVYISEVVKGGGAEKAGLTKGMIITGLDGISIDGMTTLKEQLQYYKAGEDVEVKVQVPSSNGEYEEKTVNVTLGEAS